MVEPEIPGNTGSLGRTALALGAKLHLIHPLGFNLSEKSVRRAGLDYWHHVNYQEHNSYEEFLETEKIPQENLYFFSARAKKSLFEATFSKGAYLIFGKESSGLPSKILIPNQTFTLPINTDKVRSLNLASVATTVGYFCLKDISTSMKI